MTDAAPDNVHHFPPQDAPPPAERTPPHDLDVEAAVLGALLARPDRLADIAAILSPEDFAAAAHGRVYDVIRTAAERGEAVDARTVGVWMAQDGGLEALGGAAFLAEIAEHAAPLGITGGVVSYARMVRDMAVRRRQIDALEASINDAHDARPDSSAEDVAARIADRMVDAVGDAFDDQDMASPTALADAALAPAETRSGVGWGYPAVDDILGPMRPGALYLLGGRPSMGKTAVALNVAAKAAGRGLRVYVASLEMGREQVGARLLAQASRCDLTKIDRSTLTADEAVKVVAARGRMEALQLLVDCPASMAASAMPSRVERAKRKLGGLDLVVVDYLGLLTGDQEKAIDRIGAAMKTLKRLSRAADVPILVLAQLNRGLETREDKRPMLSDLRDSGEIEQDADAVAFCYRESYYLERAEPVRGPKESEEDFWRRHNAWRERLEETIGQLDLIVAKNRQGPVGAASLRWHGPTCVVMNAGAEPDTRQSEMEGV